MTHSIASATSWQLLASCVIIKPCRASQLNSARIIKRLSMDSKVWVLGDAVVDLLPQNEQSYVNNRPPKGGGFKLPTICRI